MIRGGEIALSLIKVQIVYIMVLTITLLIVDNWKSWATLSEDEGRMQPAGCQLNIPDIE